MNRRDESLLRLELLGRLDVTDVSSKSATESHWDAESNASKNSTLAVVSQKPPPPGVAVRKRRASEGMLPVDYHDAPKCDFAIKQSQPVVLNTAQLRPAKDLGRPRAPTILRPSTALPPQSDSVGKYSGGEEAVSPGTQGFQTMRSDFVGEHAYQSQPPVSSYSTSSQHTGDSSSGKTHETTAQQPVLRPSHPVGQYVQRKSYLVPTPSYAQTGTHGQQASRPIASFAPYHPQRSQDHAVRASVSMCDTQPQSTRQWGNYNDASGQIHHSASSYSFGPRTASYASVMGAVQHQPMRVSESCSSSTALRRHPHSSSSSIQRVDGVDFQMVTPISRTASPEPLREARSRPVSTYSSMSSSRSRSPSPAAAYGPFREDRPKPKRSFLDRASERIHTKVQDTLVKAGRRPPMSHQVNRVVKSPFGDMSDSEYSRPPPPPPKDSSAMAWRQRVTKEQQALPTKMYVPPVETRAYQKPATPSYQESRVATEEDWDVSSGEEDLFFMATSRRSRTPAVQNQQYHQSVPAVMSGAIQAYPPGGIAELPVDSSLGYYELAAASDRAPPMRRCVSSFAGEAERATPTPSRPEDPLFLEGRDPRQPAGYSFFSSEYTQRQVAAQMAATAQRQQQHRAEVPRRVDQELPRSRSTAAFTHEQLELARLPSPLDLSQPVDDRRVLPSQVVPATPAPGRMLQRKKAQVLR